MSPAMVESLRKSKHGAGGERSMPTGPDSGYEHIASRPDQRSGLLQGFLARSGKVVDRPVHFRWLTDYVLQKTGGHTRPSSGMLHGRDLAPADAAKSREQRSWGRNKKRVANIARGFYETGSRNRTTVSERIGLVKPRSLSH